ncbi:MAG: nicotinate-nucleotide--dimethylbenzimidazole phosphoribosyltransferase [Halanaeroarchaeum sp.]
MDRGGTSVIVAIAVGSTATATIDGISAAGADPEAMVHTPAADAEIVTFGEPVFAPTVPVSPNGCPTPSLVTRAALDHLDVETMILDAGLSVPTAAPAASVGSPGGDVRDERPVPDAATIYERSARIGRAIRDDEVLIGESVPGGTTTAMGVLSALGEPTDVSSSLPENPIARKRRVVETGLAASDVEPGALADRPIDAVSLMGDPVLAAVAGLLAGATDGGARVVLAGGSQMAAAAAIARHAGVEAPLTLATTAFVAADETFDHEAAASALDLDVAVTDPGFDEGDHVAFERYRAGEAKEGVGMGGALRLADRADVDAASVRDGVRSYYETLVEDGSGDDDGPR